MRYGFIRIPIVIGRFLLALIFVLAGLEKAFNWSVEYGYLSSAGMPATGFFLGAATAIELIAGLMLMFGVKPRFAATILFLYLIPVTLVMHDFWNIANPALRGDTMVHFFKNVSIMGGLLAVVGYQTLVLRARTAVPETEIHDRPEQGRREAA